MQSPLSGDALRPRKCCHHTCKAAGRDACLAIDLILYNLQHQALQPQPENKKTFAQSPADLNAETLMG